MKRPKLKKYGWAAALYVLLAVAFYLIGGEQLKSIPVLEAGTESRGVFPELVKGTRLEQKFVCRMDSIESVQIMSATYARENTGILELTIEDRNGHTVLARKRLDVAKLRDNTSFSWVFEAPIRDARGKSLMFTAESFCEPGQAVSLYYGEPGQGEQEELTVNGERFGGQLCLGITGENKSLFGTHYWTWVFLFGAVLFAYMGWSDFQAKRGRLTKGRLLAVIWKKYQFLIQQLVARDFKTKYKRSVLGYLWSFLNPLLTMLVQYVVFSTIFRSDIANYPVYLLSGIILFNFFSDAIGQGLGAIVYNASLITKVYVPKYIYPVTKVASTSINLFISILPLLLVAVLTGVRITPAILLLPFVLVCLLLFCVGMVLLLCSAMVFFRDTQYLWGIISMIWMYATPLFYPEAIIPAQFRFIQTFNPMYHMIKFARIIMIQGISPVPMLYFTCLASALITCFLGAAVFKKTQDKFVLYI